MVIFEQLRPRHLPLIVLLGLCGRRLSYLRLDGKWRRSRWLFRLLAWLPVRPLTTEPLVYLRANPAGDRAFEVVDDVYMRHFAGDPYIVSLIELFGSEDLHLAFKKSLLLDLETFYYYNLLLSRVAETVGHAERAWLVPATVRTVEIYQRCYRLVAGTRHPFHETKSAGFYRWSRAVARVTNLVWRGEWLGHWFYRLGRLAVVRNRPTGAVERVEFGVTIVSPVREFANDVCPVGFLLDGQRIRPDNSLFIALAHLKPAQIEQLQQRGLRIVTLNDLRSEADLSLLVRMTPTVMSLAARGSEWVLRTAVQVLKEASLWSGFVARRRLGHLVTYCDYGVQQIARNLILRRAGARTWYYMDTSNHYHAFAGGERPAHAVAAWGFLAYDAYVSWNRLNSDYNRNHHQQVGGYFEVGVLWSELVRGLVDGALKTPGYERFREQLGVAAAGRKVVAVFDSSYNNDTITGFRQGIAFVRDILRLLREIDGIFVVFKEKKEPWVYKALGYDSMEIEEDYRALAAHPRCLVPGYQTSQAAVISLADVTISFPFTSTTLEALGARRRAVYYDALGHFKDTFYDGIPGLVLHDFRSLKERVRELLYGTDEADYQTYLDTYVRGRVDPFLDGRALTRFRNLLCE